MGTYDDAVAQVGQAASAPPNPYDAATQELTTSAQMLRSQAALTIGFGSEQNPDKAAQATMLARRYGTSPDVVAKFPDEFKQRMTVEATNAALRNAPTLQQYIAEKPEIAPVMHDDVGTLAKIDQTLAEHVTSIPAEFIKGLGGSFNRAAASVNLLAGAVPVLYSMASGDTSYVDKYFAHMVTPLLSQQERFGAEYDHHTSFVNKASNVMGNMIGMLSQITLSGTTMAPAEAGAEALPTVGQAVLEAGEHGIKAMLFPASSEAVQTGRDILDRTGDPMQAAKAAQMQYIGSTFAGMLPLGMPGPILTRIISGAGMGALGGEVARKMVNWGKPEGMGEPYSDEEMLLSAVAGSVLALGGPRHSTDAIMHEALRRTYTDAAAAEAAAKDFDRLNTLGQLSIASKWRDRDPDGFKQFMQTVTENSDVPHVFIEGQLFNDALVKAGVTQEELRALMPEVAEQMQEALHTDGYVKIPTADYASHIAGSNMDADILPNLKTDPLGKTYREAEAFYQTEADRMKESVASTVQEAEANVAFRKSQDAVTQSITEQLEALGRFPASVNKVYATIQTAILSRVAERTGITPEQAFEKYGAQLTREGVQGTTLDQTLPVPFDYRNLPSVTVRPQKADALPPQTGVHYGNAPGLAELTGGMHGTGLRGAERHNLALPGVDTRLRRRAYFYEANDNTLPEREHGTGSNAYAAKLTNLYDFTKDPAKILERRNALRESGVRDQRELSNFIESAVIDAGYDGYKSGRAMVVLDASPKVKFLGNERDLQSAYYKSKEAVAKIAAGAEAVKPQHNPPLVNIGLDVPGGGKITWDDAVRAINATGAKVMMHAIHQSDTESTLVARLSRPLTPEEAHAVSEKLHQEAIAQIADGAGELYGPKADNWKPFSPNFFMMLNGRRAAETSNAFAQSVRGFFKPGDNGAGIIGLLEHADLSTYLHETGHWALDTYAHLADRADAPAEVRADMDAILKWFNVKDLAAWHSLTVDQQRVYHEKFARGFEAYLFEGKAPSQALQPMFARIRSWLVSIYKELTGLNVTLTPEVRQVFDRMLASEDAIRDAEAARNFKPLFETKPAEMSDTEWTDYVNMAEGATQTAIQEMEAKSLRDMKWTTGAQSRALREMQKQANALRERVHAEVEKAVDDSPIYRAERWLTKGEMVDDNGDVIATTPEAKAGAKLNSDRVKEMFPDSALDRPDLENIKGMSSPKGLDPDMVADMFGFASGEDLIRQLAEREPRAEVIDGITERRMLEEHGELASPQAVRDAASEAVHNDVRARFTATGLKVLTKSPVSARMLLNGAREAAEGAIAQKRVRDLNTRQYEAAETKANKAALKAVAKDPKLAIMAQRAALLNNQLVKAAQKAASDVTRGLDYLKKFEKPSVREKIDVAFRDQIDQLLTRYDLRRGLTPEQASTKRVQSLDSFVEKLAAMKFAIDVPESLLNDVNRTHYKDLSVEEFRGLVDSVRSIDHLGREMQRVSDGDKSRLLKEVAQEAVDQTAKLQKDNKETNRGLSRIAEKWIQTKAFGRSVQASLLKMEQMIDWLDDYNSKGVFNRMVFKKIADAEGARNDLDKAVTKKWETYVKALPRDLFKNARQSLELEGEIDALTGKPQRLTWGEKIALAGIRGDAGHFGKLLKGEGWKADNVLKFLDKNMTKGEWEFVRGLADTFQDLFPLKQKMLRDLGSTAPKAVERIPFDTLHGEMTGWYWPITYDPARSHAVKMRAAKHEASLFEDNVFTRADTSTGREMTRNDNYAKPMLLSIDVLPRVLKDEIRDITTRKAIIEADRFLSQPDVRKAVTGALSEQHYDTFNSWLLSLANDAAVKPSELQMWDRIAHELRTRTTMVGLGFRISTMFMHGMTAAGESIAEAGPVAMFKGVKDKRTLAAMTLLGPKWLSDGLANFIRSDQFEANRDFIFERSAEMRNRSNELERDVREQLRDIHLKLMDPATSAVMRGKLAVEARAYQGIAMLDMASALPTWMGGYLKAMSPKAKGGLEMSEEDAVYFADKTVRNAHGGGGIKDIAAVQRGGEWFKLFTMFYTFWNHNLNRIWDTGRRLQRLPEAFAAAQDSGAWGDFTKDTGTLILRTFMYTLGVQAVHHIVHPPGKEEKEHEQNHMEKWLTWFGKAMVSSVFGGVPIARDIVNHEVGGHDYEMSPIKSALDNTDALVKDAEGKGKSDNFIKHAMTEAGYIFGMPLGQAASTTQFLSDVWSGKQHPQDMAEWWRGISSGDMRKK